MDILRRTEPTSQERLKSLLLNAAIIWFWVLQVLLFLWVVNKFVK